jgi:hypothetical protein
MTTVAITQDRDDIGRAIDEALTHVPLEKVVRGKLVALKPNETWATAEDTTAVTQADTLRAVLRAVKRHGPREIVVTGGAGAAETADVFRHTGMMGMVDEEGATFFDHNRAPFREVALEYAPERDVKGPQRSVMVNRRDRDRPDGVSRDDVGGGGSGLHGSRVRQGDHARGRVDDLFRPRLLVSPRPNCARSSVFARSRMRRSPAGRSRPARLM